MKIAARRRLLLAALVAAAFSALYFFIHQYDVRTFRGHYFSGWLLLAAIALLLLFSLRKRVSVLPLGRAYLWAQLHNYVGLLAALLVVAHVDEWWPSGHFERLLLVVALLTLGSGVAGLVLNRLVPPLMRKRGERIFLSRIRTHQSVLREAVRQRVVAAVEAGASRYFFEFYDREVLRQLLGIRNVRHHLLASSAPYQDWQLRFQQAQQFVVGEDREAINDIEGLLFQKMDLDFQYVMQALLRAWVIFHVACSYSLAMLALVHMALVYGFGGV